MAGISGAEKDVILGTTHMLNIEKLGAFKRMELVFLEQRSAGI